MSAEINPYSSPQEPAEGFRPTEGEDRGVITYRMRTALSQTRPWVTFLAILGFIGAGLMLVVGVGTVLVSITGAGLIFGVVESGVILIMAAIYFALASHLFRYGRQIREYLRSSGTLDLELALEAQKSFWKMLGIMAIIVIGLYAAMFLFIIVGAMTGPLG